MYLNLPKICGKRPGPRDGGGLEQNDKRRNYFSYLKNSMAFPGLVAHTFNLRIQKAQEGRSLWVWGHTDTHGKTLPHTNSKNEASSIFLKDTRTKEKKMLAMPHR